MEHSSESAKIAQAFGRYAGAYLERFGSHEDFHRSYDLFCREISGENPLLLDIGCGPGNIARYLLDQRPDLRIHGIDLAEGMVELARQTCPESVFEVMDCREISRLEFSPQAILIGFCLPYLSETEVLQLLSDSAAMLEKGGMVCLFTMVAENSFSRLQGSSDGKGPELRIHYYSASFLNNRIQDLGFEVLHTHSVETADASILDWILVARKHK